MGYPMDYTRVVNRNMLHGPYRDAKNGMADVVGLVCGDLRRLEADTMDDAHIDAYARMSGATRAEVRAIFEQFFQWGTPIYQHGKRRRPKTPSQDNGAQEKR